MSRVHQHPAGLSTVAASALVLLGKRLGFELSVEEAVTVVALVGGVVSALFPRGV